MRSRARFVLDASLVPETILLVVLNVRSSRERDFAFHLLNKGDISGDQYHNNKEATLTLRKKETGYQLHDSPVIRYLLRAFERKVNHGKSANRRSDLMSEESKRDLNQGRNAARIRYINKYNKETT